MKAPVFNRGSSFTKMASFTEEDVRTRRQSSAFSTFEVPTSRAKCLRDVGIRHEAAYPGKRTGTDLRKGDVFEYTKTTPVRVTAADGERVTPPPAPPRPTPPINYLFS